MADNLNRRKGDLLTTSPQIFFVSRCANNLPVIHDGGTAHGRARKIQLNVTFDMVREAAKQPHTDPLVTVAIRSDGSVESVTIVQSSGVAALDEAIRRVVHSQTPYQVFPPGLAREFDVIEIRRTWYFDVTIRLY